MAKSIKKNFIYNLLYQLTILLLPLITIPYVSRILSPIGIGINSFTSANTQYFILFGTLGISIYANKKISVARDNEKELINNFWEVFIIQFIGCCIACVMFILTLGMNKSYGSFYLLQAITIISYAIDISWYFIGIEEFKKASIRSILVRMISVVLIFIFVNKESHLYRYIFINTFTFFLGQLIMWKYIDKNILRVKNIKSLQIKRHIKPIIALFIPQIATQVYMVLDKTMIGIISTTTEVGYYDQSQKIIRVLLSLVTSLGIVMLPRMSNLLANDKEKEAEQYLIKSFKFITMLAVPITFGIISISDKFIPIFLGDGYEKVVILTIISAIIIIIIGLGNVFGTQYLLAKDKINEYTISVIIGAVCNFVLNLILIKKLNSLGAVISTVIAELTIALIQVYFSRKIISIEWLKEIKKYWISGIAMLLFVTLIGKLSVNTFILIMLQVIGGVFIYFIMLLILKDNMLIEFINKYIKSRFSIN